MTMTFDAAFAIAPAGPSSSLPDEPNLAGRRAEIDCIDDAILALIEMRLRLADHLGAAKAPGLPKRRPEREAQIIARLTSAAELAPESLVRTVWGALMEESLSRQG
jgi:chorismate mutase